MPAISCRDRDEACDWFFRDNDVLTLFKIISKHDEEAHGAGVDDYLELFYQGKVNFSDMMKDSKKFVRWA